jgi:Zn-dependent peptidase ImmA (M78 family)
MREALVPPITLTTLADLKGTWGVSLQALIRRARTLAIISHSHYRALYAQLGARGWRTQEPVAVPVERPRALRQLAELLYGVPIEYPSLTRAASLDPAFVRELLEAHAAGT